VIAPELLEIRRGITVADIGAGTGYVTLHLAQLEAGFAHSDCPHRSLSGAPTLTGC
jgi:protein-L-isoaspartate O-methyltransferase